ncbi:MAG TPA: hypothetical protein VLD63_10460, partial [Anaerolineales bacterium]|nr:hypothetical protein [Anaerolineales bacterium]
SLVAAVFTLLAIGPSSASWLLYTYALLVASGYAVSAALNPILSSRFFSGPHFGVILGTLATFYHGAAALAVWLAGHAHDLTGSYRLPLVGSLLSICVATGCVWLAAPRRTLQQRNPRWGNRRADKPTCRGGCEGMVQGNTRDER